MLITTTVSKSLLLDQCDLAFKSTGVWGVATLLSGQVALAQAATVDAATNTITCAMPHALVSGSRIKLTGVLNLPLLSTLEYRVLVLSPTTFRLLALDNTTLVTLLTNQSLTWSEQNLNVDDPLAVLINKEVVHPGFTTRVAIANLGTAVLTNGVVSKPAKLVQFSNMAASNLTYKQVLFIQDGSLQLGSLLNVNKCLLLTFEVAQTITPANTPAGLLVSFSTFS
jgi:hypothetical protein